MRTTTTDPAIVKYMLWQAINYLTDSRVVLAGAKLLTPTQNEKFARALSIMTELETEIVAGGRSPAKAA